MRTTGCRPSAVLTALIAATVVAGSALAGCSSGSNAPRPTGANTSVMMRPSVSPSASGSPVPLAARPTCALAPVSAVKAATGSAARLVNQTLQPTAVICQYVLGSGAGARTLIVRMATGVSRQAFEAERATFDSSGQRTTPVAGLYDGAYTSELTAADRTTRTLVARRGGFEVLVTGPFSLAQSTRLVNAVVKASVAAKLAAG